MTTTQLPDPVLITKPEALEKLVENLTHSPVLAVDTESNSLYAYRERVCLIQFSTPQADYLVDPLESPNLTSLAQLFRDPKIEKIFHAAEYDLICLKRDYNFTFANIFDTMVAARILGREEVGLGSMLAVEFGVRVDKRFQRANWGQRPLPNDMLFYAQLDTHYLIPMRDRLHARLIEKGLWPLADEDFKRMCAVNGRNCENKSEDCWRINGAHDLTPQKAAVLLELCRYRDEAARAMNKPIFKVISDQTLLAIADKCPSALDEFNNTTGMTPRQVNRHGKSILTAVHRGLHNKPLHPAHAQRPDERYLNRLENLRRWRKRTAEKMGVKSDVILPRDILHTIAEKNPLETKALAVVMAGIPWRLEQFGCQILEILKDSNSTLYPVTSNRRT